MGGRRSGFPSSLSQIQLQFWGRETLPHRTLATQGQRAGGIRGWKTGGEKHPNGKPMPADGDSIALCGMEPMPVIPALREIRGLEVKGRFDYKSR